MFGMTSTTYTTGMAANVFCYVFQQNPLHSGVTCPKATSFGPLFLITYALPHCRCGGPFMQSSSTYVMQQLLAQIAHCAMDVSLIISIVDNLTQVYQSCLSSINWEGRLVK
jgi:hypothetical protein